MTHQTVPIAIIKSLIYENLHLTEPSAIVVWPWERSKGPVPDDASIKDFLNGRYGEISHQKPLQFLLVGAWTFDMALDPETLRRMIEICGHPAPETLGLPWQAVQEVVEELLPNPNDLDAATRREASSAGPVNNTEVFDELPQYTLVDESSNPVDVNHLAMEGTVVENSDLDLPPPYTELPQILDTTLPAAMNEVPPSIDNGQPHDVLISLQSQDPVVAHQVPVEHPDILETLDILNAPSTTEIHLEPNAKQSVLETIPAPDQIQQPTILESLQTHLATSEISHHSEAIQNLYHRKYRCVGVNLPGAYPPD